MDDLSGQQFGAYHLVKPLGHGGMATVYKAYQPTIDRYVAIKVLARQSAADTQLLGRFRHEAKIVAQLQHPHILPIFDFGESGGYMFLATALLQGGTLADRLIAPPLALSFVEQVITQVCAALDYAHAKGIVHRDIKPTNILIDEAGNCLLADFGIAYLAGEYTRLTIPGSLMGTPAYMSPEQASGEEVGPRSDLYSVGIVLYEMLTGRVPFHADTPIALAVKHVTAPMPSPRALNPEITPALEAVVMKAVARTPADRFASAGQLATALGGAIRAPLATAPEAVTSDASPDDRVPSAETRPPKMSPSHRYAIVGAIAAGVLLISAVAVGVRWPTKNPQAAPPVMSRGADPQPILPPPPANDGHAPTAAKSRGREPIRAVHTEARGGSQTTDPAVRGAAAVEDRGTSSAPPGSLDPQSLEALCNRGDASSCSTLGTAYRDGRGVTKDEAHAATLFQRACDAGGVLACDNLGIAYGRGAGVAKDDGKAFAFFQKSCDGGRGTGCWHLGAAYEAGRGTSKDDGRAASLYQRACDIGVPGGCSDLGRAYEFGIGVAIDKPKAVQLLQRACDAGGLPGCVTLGIHYLSGEGVARDEARAVPLFLRACDGDNAAGCFQSGRVYGLGLGGVARDQVRATTYFERACNGGSGPGCMTLANRHRNGVPPLAKDEAEALKLFERACDLRIADGCSSASDAYRDGRGVEKNAVRAAEFTRRALELSSGSTRRP